MRLCFFRLLRPFSPLIFCRARNGRPRKDDLSYAHKEPERVGSMGRRDELPHRNVNCSMVFRRESKSTLYWRPPVRFFFSSLFHCLKRITFFLYQSHPLFSSSTLSLPLPFASNFRVVDRAGAGGGLGRGNGVRPGGLGGGGGRGRRSHGRNGRSGGGRRPRRGLLLLLPPLLLLLLLVRVSWRRRGHGHSRLVCPREVVGRRRLLLLLPGSSDAAFGAAAALDDAELVGLLLCLLLLLFAFTRFLLLLLLFLLLLSSSFSF